MAVSDLSLRKAKASDKPYRLTDGDGLYVIIRSNGAKWWRFDYRINGVRKTMSLGTYPEVSLVEARGKRDAARKLVASNIDPVEASREAVAEARASDENTFGVIAQEYIDRMKKMGRTEKTVFKNEWQLLRLSAKLKDRPIRQITAAEILEVIKHVEASGRLETAHRVRAAIGAVFRYAISTLRAENDPTYSLRGALMPLVYTPQAAIIEPRPFGALLRAVDEYDGWMTLRAALQIMALCFPRPIELRKAEWSHIDLEAKVWNIPAELTKMRRPHDIPLSTQAVAIFKEVKRFSGEGRLVFPSIRSLERPLSENAMNSALRRMGYAQDEHTSHGFRSSASSILNSRGFPPNVIESALAHLDPNEVRRTYNRYSYWNERVTMAQAWADICDDLKRSKRRNDDLI